MSPKPYFNYEWGWEARAPFCQLPFPIAEYDRRVEVVRRALVASDLDCALIPGDARERGNVRWLTNFYALLGRTVVVVPVNSEPVLVTSSATHGEPMHSYVYETWVRDIRVGLGQWAPSAGPTVTGELTTLLTERGLDHARFGVPRLDMFGHIDVMALSQALPAIQLIEWTREFDLCKARRSQLEVELIRTGAMAADRSILAALRMALPGITELEIAGQMELELRRGGAETVSYMFDTRVCSGPRTFLKNANPSDRRLEAGDLVFADLSATYHGYVLDACTSTVVGGDPSPDQESLLEAAAAMAEALIARAKPGVSAASLVDVIEGVAAAKGEAKWFIPYMAGHGMGCSQAEIPHLYPGSEDVLQPGHWFAMEAMVSDPRRGTAQIEGIVLVTTEGADYLSQVPLRPWRDGLPEPRA